MSDQPPTPIERLFNRLADITAHQTDLQTVADLLVAFASTERAYLEQSIGEHGDRSGTTVLHGPERGPRLTLAHRKAGQMSAVHSHHVWVAITPVTGVETHRLYHVAGATPGHAALEPVESRTLSPGQATHFAPPNDVHAHGHVEGTGDPAYVLILAGDNQRAFHRQQFNPATGEVTPLPPGEPGDWLAS